LAARRIIVPDPLLPARLAFLRTSWNHLYDAPDHDYSQVKIAQIAFFPSGNISFVINILRRRSGDFFVDKTALAKPVLAQEVVPKILS
jgi:hypothetical protein